jgi:hypothetical protein
MPQAIKRPKNILHKRSAEAVFGFFIAERHFISGFV